MENRLWLSTKATLWQANYLCDVCKRTFARSDMLTRFIIIIIKSWLCRQWWWWWHQWYLMTMTMIQDNGDSISGTCDFTPVSSLTLARSAARWIQKMLTRSNMCPLPWRLRLSSKTIRDLEVAGFFAKRPPFHPPKNAHRRKTLQMPVLPVFRLQEGHDHQVWSLCQDSFSHSRNSG